MRHVLSTKNEAAGLECDTAADGGTIPVGESMRGAPNEDTPAIYPSERYALTQSHKSTIVDTVHKARVYS